MTMHGLQCQRLVPVDHPAFAGHFPGAPVLPGVVLLAWVIDAARGLWPAGPVQVPEVKFLQPVGPGAALRIELTPQGTGLAFAVWMGDAMVAKGRLGREAPVVRPPALEATVAHLAAPATEAPAAATAPTASSGAAAPAQPATPPVLPHTASWAQQSERGNAWLLKLMATLAVVCGRPLVRWVLHPIALYFMLFSPQAKRHSRRYLARALGRPARFADGYRHVHTFATLVLDRVYFARGETQHFALQMRGLEHFDAALAAGRGAVLLGAHVGSFGALHAVGGLKPGMRVAMAMYPDNARMIHDTLRAIAPKSHLDIIALGRPGSMLAVRDWLAAGGLVGLLADRHLDDTTARDPNMPRLPFLGVEAPFGDGPLRLAQLLQQRVLFMAAVFQGGNRYEVSFEPLADFSQPAANATERQSQLRAGLVRYVQRLEALCRHAPYNWFNFHDFWHEDAAP